MLTGGYAQPGVAFDSHVDVSAFAQIPAVYPSPLKAAGQNVMLVSFFSGTVRSTPGYDKMRQLSSFVALQTGVGIGSKVELTVDLFTALGVLVLANADQSKLEADLAVVRRMERSGLFTFDEEVDSVQGEPSPEPSPRALLLSDRRHTESLESAGVTLHWKAVQKRDPLLRRVDAAVFAAGMLVGLLAGKKMNGSLAAASAAAAGGVAAAAVVGRGMF